MSYRIAITPEAQKGIDKHIKAGQKSILTKISTLFEEVQKDPRKGTGHPEQLKQFWYRRIDKKYPLVYEIREKELLVVTVSTYGHYEDK